MSDRFDAVFAPLRGQRPPTPFAAASAVRRRGRQRTVQQALAAAVVVLAVAGGGGGWAAGKFQGGRDQPRPATSPTGAPAPGPTSPPAAPSPGGSGSLGTAHPDPTDLSRLLLRPVDLGAGDWQPVTGGEPFDGPDRWYWANACPAYRSADYPSLHRQLGVQTTGYRAGTRYVHEHVHRYAPDWGARALDDVRHVLATCAGPTAPPSSPGGPLPAHYEVVRVGFTGDEALLVHEDQWVYGTGDTIDPNPNRRLIAVVRVGDLVATVLPSPEYDAAAAIAVAVKAADRLRTR